MKNYLISVIVPVYNVRKYLSECITSICNQTYRNLQIILVDDGSTDGSGEICDTYAENDHRIQVLHCENKGLVVARKRGLRCADGDYVGFVDGDDYIDADMYGEMLQKLIEVDADFIHTGFWTDSYAVNVKNIDFDERIYDRIDDKYEFIRNNTDTFLINTEKFITSSIWSKLFKRSFITKTYGEVPDIQQYGEDGIALCRCIFEASRFVTYKKAFYHYIVRSDSISHIGEYDNIVKYVGLYKAYKALFDEYGCGDKAAEDLKGMLGKLSFNYVGRIYGKKLYIERYILASVQSYLGKNIILYGAGQVGRNYFTQLARYKNCNIQAWVDNNYERHQNEIDYFKLSSPKDIAKYKYDFVIIAVSDKFVSEQVKLQLIAGGVEEDKIKWEKPQMPL